MKRETAEKADKLLKTIDSLEGTIKELGEAMKSKTFDLSHPMYLDIITNGYGIGTRNIQFPKKYIPEVIQMLEEILEPIKKEFDEL